MAGFAVAPGMTVARMRGMERKPRWAEMCARILQQCEVLRGGRQNLALFLNVTPDQLGDWDVKSGDIVSIWPWILHRHRQHWEDPDAFDMERFAGKGSRHRFQYLPFGAGPRTCVGAQFATTEALTLLVHWLGQWRFADAGHDVRPAGMVTLRPAGGLPLILERR